ncbi:unnamed protein product, partial [Ectocarpus fasciculatus]
CVVPCWPICCFTAYITSRSAGTSERNMQKYGRGASPSLALSGWPQLRQSIRNAVKLPVYDLYIIIVVFHGTPSHSTAIRRFAASCLKYPQNKSPASSAAEGANQRQS